MRTAEAAGVQVVIVPKDKSVGLTPVARKVACGAAEVLPLVPVTNLARTLKKLQEQVQSCAELSDIDRQANKRILPVLFWIGNKLKESGVEDEWIKKRVGKKIGLDLKMNPNIWRLGHEKYSMLVQQYVEGI